MDGLISTSIRVVDNAGNQKTVAGANIDLDTTADLPNQPDGNLGLTIASANLVTNNAEKGAVAFTVAGIDGDVAGVDATVSFTGVSKTTGQSSTVTVLSSAGSVNLSSLMDGSISTSISVVDDAGNQKTVAGANIDLDTSADLGSVASLTIASSDKLANKVEKADITLNLANIDQDAYTVTVRATDAASHFVDATATRITGTDTWSVADMALSGLNDGVVTITATITDDADNTAYASDTLTLDATNPTVTLAATIGTDTGLISTISSAGLTKDNTLAFAGLVSDAGGLARVEIYDGAILLGDANVSSGNWTYTTSARSDGAHNFTAKAIDLAGNITTTSAVSATVDTTISAASSVVLDLVAGSDSGDFANDNLTYVTNPVIDVAFDNTKAQVGDTIEVKRGATVLGYETLNSTTLAAGHVAVTLATALTTGSNALTAVHRDVAGNTVTSSTGLTVNLDTSTVNPVGALDVSSDTGVANDNRTNDNTTTLSGTAEIGSHVHVLLAGQDLTATTNGAGNWSVTTAALVDGTHTATVNITDIAGNTSTASATAFTLDTVAPNLRTASAGDNLEAFYNVRLLENGHTVELYFNEALDNTLTANDIANRLSVEVAGYTVGVKPNTLTIGDTSGTSGGDYRKVTFDLTQNVTLGLNAKVRYVDLTGDNTTAVLQDAAGNDLASALWNSKNISTVTDVSAASEFIKVFSSGLNGGTANDTLTYRGAGTEFLTGGAGTDTVNISTASGSSNDWFVTQYSASDVSSAGVVSDNNVVFGFTNTTTFSKSVYAQAENINVGSTHFTVGANNVLQINDATAQTVRIDPDIIQPSSSISIGSGAGADTIIDMEDSVLRVDTVVYGSASGTSGVMATQADLLSNLENILRVASANTLEVTLNGVKDTLEGMEKLSFNTADSQTTNVVLIGSTAAASGHVGQNGFGSVSDAAGNAQALFVVDDTLSSMSRASLITSLDGMLKTHSNGSLLFNLNPTDSSSTFSQFTNTSKVIFQAAGGSMVTVLVVGADGYTMDAAMAAAHAGDVVYVKDNFITTPTTYTVFKENMTFIANHGSGDNLTLQLGDYTDYSNAANSHEIKNLFLLGDGNVSVVGNQYDNVIIGNRGNNIIQGNEGNDVIDTAGGADKVYGGLGNDTLIASSNHKGFADVTLQTATVLNGGADSDTLIDSTTDGHKVNMTGGAGSDVFKFGGLSSDNGAVNLSAVILDLSARSGDQLDFTQILKGVNAVASGDLVSSYSGGNLTYNFGGGSFNTTASDEDTSGAVHATTVGLTGSVQVYMTTNSNATNALTLGSVAAPGTAVHQDVFATGSLSSELDVLLPIIYHNPLG